jgi:hypothetical protein
MQHVLLEGRKTSAGAGILVIVGMLTSKPALGPLQAVQVPMHSLPSLQRTPLINSKRATADS